jgi:hypothetical protein
MMTLHRRCGAGARRSKPRRFRRVAVASRALTAVGRSPCQRSPAECLVLNGSVSLRARNRPPTGELRGADRLNTARGTPRVWRTCGTLCRPFEPERAASTQDFDRPRCREASRPAGPFGPLASRAPSVLFPGDADLPEHDGVPGAAKKQGGGALPCRRPAYAHCVSSRLRDAEAAEPVIGRRFAPTRWLRRSKVGGFESAVARQRKGGSLRRRRAV